MRLIREPASDPWHENRAAEMVAAGGIVERAEHGGYVSVHTCTACGARFTVCPPSTTFGSECLDDGCPSYEPARDAEVYFAPDDPDLLEADRTGDTDASL